MIGSSIEGVDVHVDLQDLLDYLRIIDYSFDQNGELTEFVDNVCGGNIRLALDFIRVFVGSGHANTTKMLEIYRQSGRYSVALHEFVRAVIYGDYRDYDPRFSEITNVFDITGTDGREHFLAPIVLAFLERNSQTFSSSGYVDANGIYRYAQGIGFHPMPIAKVLDNLLRHKLIETDTKRRASSNAESDDLCYRITTVGSYYYQKLLGKFTYVDAMVVDTPIVDRLAREKIYDERTIGGRLSRAEHFRQYLDSQWSAMETAVEVFDWRRLSSGLGYEIEHIRTRVESNVQPTTQAGGSRIPLG